MCAYDTAGRRVVVVAQATPTKESTRAAVDAAAPAMGSSTAAAEPAAEPALLPTGAPVDEPIELAWPAKRSWAEVALTKAVDTVEDVAVIARRTFAKDLQGWVSEFFWVCVCVWSETQQRNTSPGCLTISAEGNIPQTLYIQLSMRHVLCVSCRVVCRQSMIDGLFRQSKSSGRLTLVAKKPVVLVLGTGWGAHSLVKVREGGGGGRAGARCTDAGTPAACMCLQVSGVCSLFDWLLVCAWLC